MTYTLYQGDLKKDKKAILSFWNRNHTKPFDDKYKWIYECNPTGKAHVCLLKHEETDRLVGMSSIFPRVFSIDNENYIAGIAGDFFVDPKHRTLGPALMLQKGAKSTAGNAGVDFIYGFPNDVAELVMKRVGYQLVGPTKRYVKIMKIEPQLIKRGMPVFLTRLLGPLLNLILQIFSIKIRNPSGRGYVCDEIERLDERFDHLWRYRSKTLIMGDRTPAYLNWKYLNDPDDVNRIFAVFNPERTTAEGYLIYCVKEDRVEIRDFAFSGDKIIFYQLMKNFLIHARSLSAQSCEMTFLENDLIADLIKPFGFLQGKGGRNVYAHCGPGFLESNPKLFDLKSWFLMNSDQDT